MTLGPLDNLTPEQMLARIRELEAELAKCQTSQTGLYEGDRVRIEGDWGIQWDCTVEKFRDCLGVFLEPQNKAMGQFTPLCSMYGFGAGSEHDYMPNFGEYIRNPVPLWMQLPRLKSPT